MAYLQVKVGLERLTALVMRTFIFWDITPCIMLKFNPRFARTYRLNHKARRISQEINQNTASFTHNSSIKKCRGLFLHLQNNNTTLSLHGSTALWDLAAYFSVSKSYTQSVRLPGRGISPSEGRYLHTEQHKQRINTQRHPCLEWFELTNPVFERVKTGQAIDRAASVMGNNTTLWETQMRNKRALWRRRAAGLKKLKNINTTNRQEQLNLQSFSDWPCRFCQSPSSRGNVVGWGTMLQAGWSRVWFPIKSLDFFD
jgi:hypothetical protein